jgi:hypothetical protein
MNHVFRRHDQLDLAIDGHVQLVDLALPGRVLQLPHPLLADHVNFDRIRRRFVLLEINRAPQPNIVIAMTKGMTVQSVSSLCEPAIGRGISYGVRRR